VGHESIRSYRRLAQKPLIATPLLRTNHAGVENATVRISMVCSEREISATRAVLAEQI
jgi:hypothetical protein